MILVINKFKKYVYIYEDFFIILLLKTELFLLFQNNCRSVTEICKI